MKNIHKFKHSSEHPDIGENFWMYKFYEGHAQQVLYILNDIAKNNFKKYLNVDADYCVLKYCIINKWQESLLPTDDTVYSLYKNDEQWIPRLVLINWKKINKPSLKQFRTHSWIHADWRYVWLLISEQDINIYKQKNKEAIEQMILAAWSQ